MIKIETKVLFQERVMVMALAQATKSHEPTYTINDAMDVLLSRLDEAIDDMESDRVQIVEEAWAEMEKRKYKVVIAQSGKLDVKEKRNISFSNLNTGSMQRIFPKRLKSGSCT